MAEYSKNWNVDGICMQNMNDPSQNHLVSGFCPWLSILKTGMWTRYVSKI
jgi:hypothetical protein